MFRHGLLFAHKILNYVSCLQTFRLFKVTKGPELEVDVIILTSFKRRAQLGVEPQPILVARIAHSGQSHRHTWSAPLGSHCHLLPKMGIKMGARFSWCCYLGHRGLIYDEQLNILKLPTIDNGMFRHDLVFAHRILNDVTYLQAFRIFKFSMRPE